METEPKRQRPVQSKNSPIIDEAKLSEGQRKALAIAKAQGKHAVGFDELVGDLKDDDIAEMFDSLLGKRKEARKTAVKIRF